MLCLNMEEGKVYILQNVSVMKNGAEFRLGNHEYKLKLTRFSVVTSMLSKSLSQLSCLKPVPFEAFTDSTKIPTYCIGIIVAL